MAFDISINDAGKEIRRANKKHDCSWCTKSIEKGTEYVIVAKKNGFKYPEETKFHKECFKADVMESAKKFIRRIIGE